MRIFFTLKSKAMAIVQTLFFSLFFSVTLSSQTTTFPGGTITLLSVPDTIVVGSNCTAPLNWGGNDSVQVAFNAGYLGTKTYKGVSTGSIGSPIIGGTTVTVTYEIKYTTVFPNPQVFLFNFEIYFADRTAPVFAALPPSVMHIWSISWSVLYRYCSLGVYCA